MHNPDLRQPVSAIGLIATLMWLLLIALVFLLIQALVLGIYVGLTQTLNPGSEALKAAIAKMQWSGSLLATATIASGLICSGVILLAVWLQKNAIITGYLGLKTLPVSSYLRWGLLFILVLLIAEVALVLTEQDSVPNVMVRFYQSASPKWLLWLAIVLVAPIFEELLFRGFLYQGLRHSFFGVSGAIFVTALMWAAIHVQYELFYMGIIFVFGVIFGYSRHKSGSLLIPVFLHVLNNLISTVQMAFKV